jgi:diguanylate cyclase (GGDEF)-like protein
MSFMTENTIMDETEQAADKPVILIVDDSRVMRIALKKILRENYEVIEAVDGEDAWSKLVAEPSVQIVFSDLSMPELDGFGLLERIRKSEESWISNLPFIVITGNEDDDGMREKAVSCGANDLVTKPFQSVEIKTRAKSHIKHRAEIHKASETIKETRITDVVTGLANEKYFMKRASEDVAYSIRHKRSLALICMKISNLEEISEKYGKQAVEEAVKTVADILRPNTRTEDTIAYFDDAKFVLMLPAADTIGSTHLGKRIMVETASKQVQYNGQSFSLSACMGISSPEISTDIDMNNILSEADARMKQAISYDKNSLLGDEGLGVISLDSVLEELAVKEEPKVIIDNKANEELTKEISVFKSVIDDLNKAIKQKESELEMVSIEKQDLEAKTNDKEYEVVRLKAELNREEQTRKELQDKIEAERLELETSKKVEEEKRIEEINEKLRMEEGIRVKTQFELHKVQKEIENLIKERDQLLKYRGMTAIWMSLTLPVKVLGSKIGVVSKERIEEINRRLGRLE